ncbi:tyrosyl-DNA phosphodiesterase-domain-containing protein [Geopyxis carbonaria]|nr:tyrosyl-DNA phosphodiesterase-domain-containing protein [Geopyxis carbonaria]
MPQHTHSPLTTPERSPDHSNKRQRLDAVSELPSVARSVSPPPVSSLPAAPSPTSSHTVVDLTGADSPYTRNHASPFRLTTIRNLPPSENADTVSITTLLSSPLLSKIWIFNFCHDIEWTMSQLDPDIAETVPVTFVHGHWKRDDPARLLLEQEAKQYSNVKLAAAYMPEPFGTHHTKMLVLFRRDDLARVVIHTANMLAFDWGNMTQAAWLSPWLPRADAAAPAAKSSPVGEAFKTDLLAYLRFYSTRTAPLVAALQPHSFAAVRAIFIGSVPGRHKLSDAAWGWPKLRRTLSKIPSAGSLIVAQVSSVATLGQSDTWLSPVLLPALAASRSPTFSGRAPRLALVYPAVREVRDSLNGYASGTSLHFRRGTPAQEKQLANLAAPHIKTYMRMKGEGKEVEVEWALLSSANISTQAWGAAAKEGVYRVCSYEAGVLPKMTMKPSFKSDRLPGDNIVALRMPYDLPLSRYASDDQPWWSGGSYGEADWLGQKWNEKDSG